MSETLAAERAFIRGDLEGSAQWRRRLAERFTDDARNLRAAEILERLVETVDDIADEIVVRHARTADMAEIEEWDRAVREVGFHRFPDTAEELLREVFDAPDA